MTAHTTDTPFSAWLKAAMTAKYGTGPGAAAQLARDSGVSEQSISRYRRALGGTPNTDNIKRLAAGLGLPADDALAAAGARQGDARPPVSPAAAVIGLVHREGAGLPEKELSNLESEALRQIGFLEDYIRIKANAMREDLESAAPSEDNGTSAS